MLRYRLPEQKGRENRQIVWHLQNPRIIFRNLNDKEKIQHYDDGKWSDVFENTYKPLD